MTDNFYRPPSDPRPACTEEVYKRGPTVAHPPPRHSTVTSGRRHLPVSARVPQLIGRYHTQISSQAEISKFPFSSVPSSRDLTFAGDAVDCGRDQDRGV